MVDDTTVVDDKKDDGKQKDQASAEHQYPPGRVVSVKDLYGTSSGLGVNGQNDRYLNPFYNPSSALSASKDDTFVTVEEFDPEEKEAETAIKIKKEPVSPTFPKATLFSQQQEVAIDDSVADEHFSTPLQSPVPAAPPNSAQPSATKLKENHAPLWLSDQSRAHPLSSRFPHYYEQQAKRSASPSPSSQLRNETRTIRSTLTTLPLANNVNTSTTRQSPAKTSEVIKATPPIPNSSTTADPYRFPPTSPLNSKTPKPFPPNRMLQFDSSPNNRFSSSPSKSTNKCTPVPLPHMNKGFLPPAPRLSTPFTVRVTGTGTREDPLTPADVDDILDSVLSKDNSGGDKHKMDGNGPATKRKELGVDMPTIKKEPRSEDNVVAGASPMKKTTKKTKKGKNKRLLEESNAVEDNEKDITAVSASAPSKKAKKPKKKKTKKADDNVKVNEEDQHDISMDMDLDGPTEIGEGESTILGETTQLEVDRQLQEAMAVADKTEEHAASFKTVAAPAAASKDGKQEDSAEQIQDIITELMSPNKKRTNKKARKAMREQQVEEEQQVVEAEETVAPVDDIADPMEIEPVTAMTPISKILPAPKAKSTQRGHKDSLLTTASGLAAAISGDPLLSIAKHFVKFDNTLTYNTEISQAEITAIKQNLTALDQRIQANELRASIRQEILFNALKKVSMDINKLSTAIAKGGAVDSHAATDDPEAASPGEVARDRLSRSARATTVAPKGSIHSTTPIPLPMFGSNKAVVGGSNATPSSGARGAVKAGSGGGGGGGGATGGGVNAATAEARKNQDKLLAGFTKEMNAATDAKTVEVKGRLVVKYADDLFKMF
ncbi:hypothetical protein B0T20DRAFT_348860 [Sordaria brevicollis]|uniref:Uncharacterized protein n=1 Tax=Sordaria brevicollis TaxID=83679 RepID=A0AAE0PIB0_SORBR|nr:hypothetical protein B0T20DRAFT_348860 [Sordaria brevicollis]